MNELSTMTDMKILAQNLETNLGPDDSSEGELYGNFTREGQWTMGPDDDLVPDDEFAVNILTMKTGHVCWVGGEVRDECVVPILGKERQTPRGELPDHGPYTGERDGWMDQRIIQMKGVNTEVEICVKKGTDGFIKAFKGLGRAILVQMRNGANCLPIVKLESDFYVSKKYGNKTYFPIIRIVRWVAGPDDIKPAEKPKTKPKVKIPAGRGSMKDTLDDEVPF